LEYLTADWEEEGRKEMLNVDPYQGRRMNAEFLIFVFFLKISCIF